MRPAYGRAAPASGFAMPGTPGWVLPAYYGISGWWFLNGVWTVLSTLISKNGASGFGVIIVVIGGLTALVGLGLILRIDAVRGIVNVLCALNILFGAIGLITAFFMTGVFGIWAAIGMIRNAIQIAMAGLMIYLIGETDTHAPNF